MVHDIWLAQRVWVHHHWAVSGTPVTALLVLPYPCDSGGRSMTGGPWGAPKATAIGLHLSCAIFSWPSVVTWLAVGASSGHSPRPIFGTACAWVTGLLRPGPPSLRSSGGACEGHLGRCLDGKGRLDLPVGLSQPWLHFGHASRVVRCGHSVDSCVSSSR